MTPAHPPKGAPTWVAMSVVALLLLVVAVATGGGEEREPAPRAGGERGGAVPVRTQAGDSDPVAAQVRSAADRLPTAAQVAQLFLVDTGGAVPRARDWGGLRVGPKGPSAALRRAIRRTRGVRPLLAAEGLPAQPPLARRSLPRVAAEYRRAAAGLRRAGVGLALDLSLDLATAAGPLAGIAFSDDPERVSALGVAALEGLEKGRLAAAVSHFPGQGAASQAPIDGPAVVGLSRDTLLERDLEPFRAAAPRTPVMMVSSAIYTAFDPTTPAAHLPALVQGELRGRLGFRGVAMTDRLAGLAVVGDSSPGAAAVRALQAGIDLVRASDEREAEAGRAAVLQALRERRLSPARVREALERVLELKRGAGLL